MAQITRKPRGMPLDEVCGIITAWIDRYNEIRPHEALGSLPPAPYHEQLLAAETPV